MIRLGFLGTGHIGRNRMEAMLATGEAVAMAICAGDTPEASRFRAQRIASMAS